MRQPPAHALANRTARPTPSQYLIPLPLEAMTAATRRGMYSMRVLKNSSGMAVHSSKRARKRSSLFFGAVSVLTCRGTGAAAHLLGHMGNGALLDVERAAMAPLLLPLDAISLMAVVCWLVRDTRL
ncbi:hypothetical protein I4F81_001901 [Pyropia yezoensis]|uniref:Uncharacterized protein n=1 Tax=Pyropia yezoensis TaxID=2788 RepID=A0ACC3BMY1_PYRYE|nr:hypothetical protein I4F81_001901 [Neopyropia yezoensis]